MKTLSIRIVVCFLSFLVNIGAIHAQQFKWVTGGGTTEDLSSAASSEWEQVKNMCTDPNGNVYVLSQVGSNPVIADTFH